MNTEANKKRITLITGVLSGSNTYSLYKAVPKYILQKYDIRLETIKDPNLYSEEILNSDVFVTTHGHYAHFKDKINIELWHGFPLKTMANMDIEEESTQEDIADYWNNVNLIMSYSPLYNTLMNACMGTRINQYRITGMPRNDLLFSPDSKKKLSELLGKDLIGKKIVFYMPTYRKINNQEHEVDGEKSWSNVFGFNQFDHQQFHQFLKENNIALVVKLHPFEESLFKDQVDVAKDNHIYLLTNQILSKHVTDLYEVLGCNDALITDYSSVYFDTLLVDKPIIFTPVDLKEYRKSRGFLLEPYEEWTPGPKVLDQDALESELLKSLRQTDYYKTERDRMTRMVHTYQDAHSCKRTWEVIDQYIEQSLINASEPIQDSVTEQKDSIKGKLSILIEQGHVEQADDMINKYEELFGVNNDNGIICMKSIIQYISGHYAEAIELLMKSHAINPLHFDTLFNLAQIHEQIGNPDQALRFYKESLAHCDDINLKATIEQSTQDLSRS